MVNFVYLNHYNSAKLNELMSKDAPKGMSHEHPENKLSYKSTKWVDFDQESMHDIFHLEREDARLDSESNTIYDMENRVEIAISSLDRIIGAVNDMFENLVRYRGLQSSITLQSLKYEAKNAIKVITNSCNVTNSKGDYVMSGNAIKTKPFPEGSLEYVGGKSNIKLNLDGQSIGELVIRGDNKAITNTLKLFNIIISEQTFSIGDIQSKLKIQFNDIINVREEVAIFLKSIKQFKEQYKNYATDVVESHKGLADQNMVDYKHTLDKHESQYMTAGYAAKKMREMSNRQNNI